MAPKPNCLRIDMAAKPKFLRFGMTTRPNTLKSFIAVKPKLFKKKLISTYCGTRANILVWFSMMLASF
jgi:hypothetical protein